MSEASAQTPALAALERLPAETTIHVVALTGFCVLSLGLVLALDGMLAGEDLISAALFPVVAIAIAVGIKRYLRERHSPLSGSMLRRAIVIGVLRSPLRRVGSLRRWAARIKPKYYAPLDPSMALAALARQEVGPHVTLLWAPTDPQVDARAIGSSERPTIAATAGLCRLAESRPDEAVFVLRHEEAHLRNRDLRVFAVLLALVGGWRAGVIAGITTGLCLGWLGFFGSHERLVVAFVLLVACALMVVFLVASFFLCAKYQSFILAVREAHADAHAALASTRRGGAAWPSKPPEPEGHWRKFCRCASPSFTHFPARVRVRLVSQPWRMAAPKARYFTLVGLLLGTIELNVGPDHLIAFQATWALAWSLFAVAFVANTFRFGLFLGDQGWQIARSSALLRVAIVAFAGGVTLSLPWWRSQCLEGQAPQLALSFIGLIRGSPLLHCDDLSDLLSPLSSTAAVLGAGCALVCTQLSAVAGKHASRRSQGYSPRAVWLAAVLFVLPTFVCLVAERWTRTSGEDLNPPTVVWSQIAMPHLHVGATRSEIGLLSEGPSSTRRGRPHFCSGRPQLVLVEDESRCFPDPIVVWLSKGFGLPGLLLGLGALLSSAVLLGAPFLARKSGN